jgi:hypothetical protein
MFSSACKSLRVADPDADGSALMEHGAACAACARWSARRREQVQRLRCLRRLATPADLADALDRTLAAAEETDGSDAEARAMRQLFSDTLKAKRAPAALAQRVSGDLADLPAAVSGSFLRRLARRKAPAELVARLERAPVRRGLAARQAWLVAAGALVGLGLWAALRSSRPAGRALGGRALGRIEIVRVASPRDLSPWVRGWVAGATGALEGAGGL